MRKESGGRDAYLCGGEANFIEQIAGGGQRRIAADGDIAKTCDRVRRVCASEEEIVGTGAPDESGIVMIDGSDGSVVQGETVHDDGTVIERACGFQGCKFLSSIVVDSLAEMNDERAIGRGVPMSRREILFKSDRVSPADIANDANGEVFRKCFSEGRVVMADRVESTKQIAESTEPDAGRLWNSLMASD